MTVAGARGGSIVLKDVEPVTFRVPSASSDFTYTIEYGDGAKEVMKGGEGQPAGQMTAVHTYRSSGEMAVKLTIADAQSRTASSTAALTVRSIDGVWVNTFFNASANRSETRYLDLKQQGGDISGSYMHPEGNVEPLTGTVGSGGALDLSLVSRTIAFKGTVNADVTSLTETVTGGTANGMTLTFPRSNGPLPPARTILPLSALVDYGPVPVQVISTVVFVTVVPSAGVTYRIDFGDGQSDVMGGRVGPNSNARAFHEYRATGTYLARVTATSGGSEVGYGETSVTVRNLTGRWVSNFLNPSTGKQETRVLVLTQASASTALSGTYTTPTGATESVTGAVSAPRSIRIYFRDGSYAYGTDLDGDGINGSVDGFSMRYPGNTLGSRWVFTKQ